MTHCSSTLQRIHPFFILNSLLCAPQFATRCSVPSGDVSSSQETTAEHIIASCSTQIVSVCVANEFSGCWNSASSSTRPPGDTYADAFIFILASGELSWQTKTNKHPVRQEAKQLAVDEQHKDAERDRELRQQPIVFFPADCSASKWECGQGVDLWLKLISLHLLIFCLPPADKIDRIHRYFMMQKISCY